MADPVTPSVLISFLELLSTAKGAMRMHEPY